AAQFSRVRRQRSGDTGRGGRGRGVVPRLTEHVRAGDAVRAAAPDVARGASRRDRDPARIVGTSNGPAPIVGAMAVTPQKQGLNELFAARTRGEVGDG